MYIIYNYYFIQRPHKIFTAHHQSINSANLRLSVFLYVYFCPSVFPYVCKSVYRIYHKPSTRPPSRSAGILHGSRQCALSSIRMCEHQNVHINEFLCCAFANILRSAICIGVSVLVAKWRIWASGGQYITMNISLRPITHSTGTCTSNTYHYQTVAHRFTLGRRVMLYLCLVCMLALFVYAPSNTRTTMSMTVRK